MDLSTATPPDMSSASPVPRLMVLYEDDAVHAEFHDNVSIRLSPCGANVTVSSEKGTHTSHQRTQFILSAHCRHAQTALDFRNRFAENIFLCQEIYGWKNVLEYYTDITSVTWPTTHHAVITLEGGATQLTSIDDCATITLASNTQEFSIQFLCQISGDSNTLQTHKKGKSSSCGGKPVNTSLRSRRCLVDVTHKLNFDSEEAPSPPLLGNSCENQEPMKVERSLLRLYVWQVQNCSVVHCPVNWRYPLRLLQTASQPIIFQDPKKHGNEKSGYFKDTTHTRDEESKNVPLHPDADIENIQRDNSEAGIEDSTSRKQNVSVLPWSLPLRCSRSDLHCMLSSEPVSPVSGEQALKDSGVRGAMSEDEDRWVWLQTRRLKAFFSRGVLYRVFWHPEPSVEVYPGDGSLLRSMPGSGGYFTLFSRHDGSLKEQVLSTRVPPPDSVYCGEQSLSSLLQRGQRLLMHMEFIDRNTNIITKPVCWKLYFPQPTERRLRRASRTPSHPIEECDVEGVGHFSAFSNGYIRVNFCDRTILEFQIDISGRSSDVSKGARIFLEDTGKILLPNGEGAHVDLRNPEVLAKYVDPALEWAGWVMLPESQRRAAHADTIHDVGRIREVAEELTRLRRFNYEAHNLGAPCDDAKLLGAMSSDSTISNVEIQRLLGQNMAKIEDIDNILNMT